MKRLPLVLAAVLLLCLATASPVLAQTFPQPQGLVSDYAGLLSPAAEQQLEARLLQLERDTTHEVAVVTIISLEGEPPEDYAVGLFEAWGIGKQDQDNGILFLIALEDREMRIEVGYGLEGVITDGRAGRILDREVVPHFKNGDYESGIIGGVAAIEAYLRDGVPPSFPEDNPVQAIADKIDMPDVVFIVLGIISIYLLGFMARTRSIWLGGIWGVVAGIIIGLVLAKLWLVIVLPLAAGGFGTLLDWLLSRNYKARSSSGRPTSWGRAWGGFSGGGGGRSSGGGFHFGGGMSGGGGAGRGW